jgi:ElaB/YqjD/DUF883 family membrane-anchored ribosome-binding protein
MDTDKIAGQVKNGAGKLEKAAGQALDDPGMEVSGEARELQGKVQETIGAARERISKSADKAKAALSQATDQAGDAYVELRQRAQQVAEQVDPFVKEKPYAALAIAGIVGLVIGALFFSGGARVIYVKPSRG